MLDIALEFNTPTGERKKTVRKCKLLFANVCCGLHSVEVFCDEVVADRTCRLLRCEDLSFFDHRLLACLYLAETGVMADAAIAYSVEDRVCRFIFFGVYSDSLYAAVALAAFYRGELDFSDRIRVISPEGECSVSISGGDGSIF